MLLASVMVMSMSMSSLASDKGGPEEGIDPRLVEKPVFSVEYPDELKLTMEQYYEQNPAGDYWQYYDEYWGRMSMYMEYKTFYPKTRQIEVISEGAMRFMGEGEHQRPFYLSGVYDGKWLAVNYDEIGFIYYCYDPSNSELEEFLRTDKEKTVCWADITGKLLIWSMTAINCWVVNIWMKKGINNTTLI